MKTSKKQKVTKLEYLQNLAAWHQAQAAQLNAQIAQLKGASK